VKSGNTIRVYDSGIAIRSSCSGRRRAGRIIVMRSGCGNGRNPSRPPGETVIRVVTGMFMRPVNLFTIRWGGMVLAGSRKDIPGPGLPVIPGIADSS